MHEVDERTWSSFPGQAYDNDAESDEEDPRALVLARNVRRPIEVTARAIDDFHPCSAN